MEIKEVAYKVTPIFRKQIEIRQQAWRKQNDVIQWRIQYLLHGTEPIYITPVYMFM